eukprot:SAG11_NODE_2189_length_3707_cov_2.141075_4_plen_169_part_00
MSLDDTCSPAVLCTAVIVDSTVMETDMEQAIILGKADLFEAFLHHTADLIEDLAPSVSEVLNNMAQAHNIIHETKEGIHREKWEQDVESNIAEHMTVWREVHQHGGGDHANAAASASAHLKEFKEENQFRTKVVLDYAMVHVKKAFLALRQQVSPTASLGCLPHLGAL